MFKNIGKKIKGLSTMICIIGIIVSIIGGLACMYVHFALFILIAGVGSLLSWIGSFFMYGFGELIDTTCQIRESLFSKSSFTPQTNHQSTTSTEEPSLLTVEEVFEIISSKEYSESYKTYVLEEIYSKGMISNEVYRKKIKEITK